LTSPFAQAQPYAVELDFVTTVAGQAVSGRMDAVFHAQQNPDLVPKGAQVLIVDWKTGNTAADPLQLAVYAHAWAAMYNVPGNEIAAGFFHVPTGQLRQADLSGGVEDLLSQAGWLNMAQRSKHSSNPAIPSRLSL
jgi:DNA helicase-2/ATP-dependent DNA helicase PcrA